ncbi:F-box domain-containing protein [Favolaschia claudopus]|uniref:F-box domain-containing protein n=1 Tax=Favolaschia claudopus TaxID=2862362 RepID=A0AAW0BPQ8_9AGAR
MRSHTGYILVWGPNLYSKIDQLAAISCCMASITPTDASLTYPPISAQTFYRSLRTTIFSSTRQKYPVLKIPNEIISEIFVQFLATYPLCPAPTDSDSPTLLTQICSQWRQVALSTPQLWRAIVISGPGYARGEIQAAKDWLSRSGCCSLSVDIRVPPNILEQHRLGRRLLTALASRRAQLEHLAVAGTPTNPPLLNGPLPRLHHLNLHILPVNSSGSIELDSEAAPLLCSAVLFDWACRFAKLPWEQLTTLVLRSDSSETFCSILELTLNLVHCELDFDIYGITSNYAALPEVCLPRLRSLILNGPDENDDGRLLESLIAPELRSLTVSEQCFTILDVERLDLLSSFISKSACKLDQLSIIYSDRLSGPSIAMEDYYFEFSSIPNISASPRMRL